MLFNNITKGIRVYYLEQQKQNSKRSKYNSKSMNKRFLCTAISSIIILISFLPEVKGQYPEALFGHEARLKSWEKHLELKHNSPFKDLEWRVAGPEFMGGRIESIAIHPERPSTIFVAPGSGNIWKSINHGTTWKPVFDEQPAFAMGCIGIAPSDPDIIWAGTGEVLMARSSYAGLGVFKSLDEGETWEHMGLAGSYHISRIVIDPLDPDIVYVAAIGHNYTFNEERGVYKTVDGGKSWEKVLYISDKTGIIELVMDPADNNTLYAVSWERDRKAWNNIISGKESGLWKSTDGGKEWTRLEGGLPSGQYLGRMGIAIAPSNPDIVYVIVDNQTPAGDEGSGKTGGELYRSEDAGLTWTKTHEGPFPTGIGYDFCLVRVSPADENDIYVPGWKLIRSKDGGKTFSFTGDTVVHILSHDIRVMHLDMHDMLIDSKNPSKLLLGNDGGLYCSWDGGNTWLHYNNFPIGEFYAVSVDNADPYNIYGGTQDNAALYGPGNHNVKDRLTKFGTGDPWKHVYLDRWGGGDSYFTVADPYNPDEIYYEHQFGALRRKNMKTGETVNLQPEAPEGEDEYRFNWMTPFIISKYNPETIYYGTQKVLKSTDRGNKWIAISPDLSTEPGPERSGNVPFGTITSISESPLKQGLIYAGTDDGNIHITRNDGKKWELISKSLPGKWVSRLRASRHKMNTVYATFTGYRDDDFQTYIFKSDDAGKSWTSIASNLPSEPVNVIIEDPRDADILYIGTDLTVYVTLNGGKEWLSLSNHLPTCAVYDLAIQDRELDLIAGTHGRSVFVIDIEGIK